MNKLLLEALMSKVVYAFRFIEKIKKTIFDNILEFSILCNFNIKKMSDYSIQYSFRNDKN